MEDRAYRARLQGALNAIAAKLKNWDEAEGAAGLPPVGSLAYGDHLGRLGELELRVRHLRGALVVEDGNPGPVLLAIGAEAVAFLMAHDETETTDIAAGDPA